MISNIRRYAFLAGLLCCGAFEGQTQPMIERHEDTIDLRKGRIISDSFWLVRGGRRLDLSEYGPFVSLKAGRMLTVDSTSCLTSADGGKTWTRTPIFSDHARFMVRPERALIRTRKGTLILAFANDRERSAFRWDRNTHDVRDAMLPTYVVRSEDEGRTWSTPVKLHDEWTGAIRDIIETKDGHVIFTSMMIRHDPGHHAVVTYTSADDGQHWTRGQIVDLGGIGDHDGTIESTLEERQDGSIYMLLRTNWGYFWETISGDRGLTWRSFRSTNIDASSSPGILKRLSSGRWLLAWNRYYPQGKNTYRLVGGDRNFSAFPVSLHREELSVMISEDEGRTWSAPVVVAKTLKPRLQLSYPYLFEPDPGEIWLSFPFSNLRFSIREQTLLKMTKSR
ncbi:MAG: sialidase family protein [bacterium]|jgi:sialidase-1